jgi:hypothetical protein
VTSPKILDLPFTQRPLRELLHLESPGPDIDATYAGYGWARADRLWLETQPTLYQQPIDDALVLAIHAADDGDRLSDDIDLEFELTPGGDSFFVRASRFLEKWLPQLPGDSAAIVLAMCNPFHAALRPVPSEVPIYYARGDVDAWIDEDDLGTRIRLSAPSWGTIGG